MVGYALAVFLSAWLLFQVQPLLGKCILPWFGGSPAVWTTCMLFFQVVLLAGYAYAHLVMERVGRRWRAVVHGGLLAGSLALLPILPEAEAWKPDSVTAPTWHILALLTATVGGPYFLLSATGPLLQAAFHRRWGRTPYRLYAVSNAGSLLALLSYPLVIEPRWPLGSQSLAWSVGYGLFTVLCTWCLARSGAAIEPETPAAAAAAGPRPTAGRMALWVGLAACGSLLLLATTNQVCQDVASVPLLWVVPLAMYLVSFIVCFDRPHWYRRGRWLTYLATASALTCLVLCYSLQLSLGLQLTVFLGTLLVSCLVCHGELARARPEPRYLTLFYLLVSLGGAVGGVLGAVVAPLIFLGFWELHLALAATWLLALVAWSCDPTECLRRALGTRARWALGGLVVALVGALATQAWSRTRHAVEIDRNFYGLVTIAEQQERAALSLLHGQIEHGFQFTDPERRRWPTTYYGPNSGAGVAIVHHRQRARDAALRVGVVGLGCGTLAAYARPGDVFRFYEINPAVVRCAREYFSYLADAPAEIATVLGDARLVLEREAAGGQEPPLDVLVIDAFSGDAIPMHLLTRQSLSIYRRRLRPDGLLCFHVSNKYLDLTPVLRGLAWEAGLEAALFESGAVADRGVGAATWVILTTDRAFLGQPAVAKCWTPWPADAPPPLVWTDDYGSLRQVLTH